MEIGDIILEPKHELSTCEYFKKLWYNSLFFIQANPKTVKFFFQKKKENIPTDYIWATTLKIAFFPPGFKAYSAPLMIKKICACRLVMDRVIY